MLLGRILHSKLLWILFGTLCVGVILWIWLSQPKQPIIPPGLVEKRQEVGDLLRKSASAEDTDIRGLVDLEAKKKYGDAVSLMERALAANQVRQELNASLVSVAGELAALAIQVKPDGAGAQAIETFGFLQKFAEANQKYYQDRKMLYVMTRDYYAALAAKESPAIPDTLKDLVTSVTDAFTKADGFSKQFASAISGFDQLIAGTK